MAGRRDIEAGSAFVRLFLKDEMTQRLAAAVDRAGKKLQAIGAGVARAGAVITTAGAAISAPMAVAVRHFAKFGDTLDKMSARTGVGVAALAEFGFAAEQSGSNLEAIEKAVRRMQKTIGDAQRGLSTAVDGLAKLNLAAAELDGMSPEDQFQLIADRLGMIEDPTRRASAAMDVFGSRVGTAILPMLENLSELRQEARDLGIVPTEAETKKAAAVTDALNRIKRAAEGTLFVVGAQLADAVLMAADAVKAFAVRVQTWVRNNPKLIQQIASLGVGLLAVGSAVTALGGVVLAAGIALSGFAVAIATVGGMIGALLSPIGLITAAVVAGVAGWARYAASGKTAVMTLRTLFGSLWETARAAFGGILDALKSGDLVTAGEIAGTALQLAWLESLQALQSATAGVFGNVLQSIAKVVDGVVDVWNWGVDQLTSAWGSWGESTLKTLGAVASAIPKIWRDTVESMANFFLTEAAQGGLRGKVFGSLLGVDMSQEAAQKQLLDRKNRELNIRQLEDALPLVREQLRQAEATGDTETAEKKRAQIEQFERELGVQRAGGKQTNIFDDARDSVSRYLDELTSPEARKTTTQSTTAQSLIEGLLGSANAGNLDSLRRKLSALRESAASSVPVALGAAGIAATEEQGGISGLGSQGPGFAPTFSAAAAMAGLHGGTPQQRIEQLTRQHVDLAKKQLDADLKVIQELEKFNAGMVYG